MRPYLRWIRCTPVFTTTKQAFLHFFRAHVSGSGLLLHAACHALRIPSHFVHCCPPWSNISWVVGGNPLYWERRGVILAVLRSQRSGCLNMPPSAPNIASIAVSEYLARPVVAANIWRVTNSLTLPHSNWVYQDPWGGKQKLVCFHSYGDVFIHCLPIFGGGDEGHLHLMLPCCFSLGISLYSAVSQRSAAKTQHFWIFHTLSLHICNGEGRRQRENQLSHLLCLYTQTNIRQQSNSNHKHFVCEVSKQCLTKE